jgi:hypothetical protein
MEAAIARIEELEENDEKLQRNAENYKKARDLALERIKVIEAERQAAKNNPKKKGRGGGG